MFDNKPCARSEDIRRTNQQQRARVLAPPRAAICKQGILILLMIGIRVARKTKTLHEDLRRGKALTEIEFIKRNEAYGTSNSCPTQALTGPITLPKMMRPPSAPAVSFVRDGVALQSQRNNQRWKRYVKNMCIIKQWQKSGRFDLALTDENKPILAFQYQGMSGDCETRCDTMGCLQ